MNGGVEVHVVRIAAVPAFATDLSTEERGILIRLVRRLKVLKVILLDEAFDGALDLVDVEEGGKIRSGGLGAEATGDFLAAVEAVACADGDSRVVGVRVLAAGDAATGGFSGEKTGFTQKGEREESAGLCGLHDDVF